MAILDVEKYGTIDLGRSSIDIFNEYLIIGGRATMKAWSLRQKMQYLKNLFLIGSIEENLR